MEQSTADNNKKETDETSRGNQTITQNHKLESSSPSPNLVVSNQSKKDLSQHSDEETKEMPPDLTFDFKTQGPATLGLNINGRTKPFEAVDVPFFDTKSTGEFTFGSPENEKPNMLRNTSPPNIAKVEYRLDRPKMLKAPRSKDINSSSSNSPPTPTPDSPPKLSHTSHIISTIDSDDYSINSKRSKRKKDQAFSSFPDQEETTVSIEPEIDTIGHKPSDVVNGAFVNNTVSSSFSSDASKPQITQNHVVKTKSHAVSNNNAQFKIHLPNAPRADGSKPPQLKSTSTMIKSYGSKQMTHSHSHGKVTHTKHKHIEKRTSLKPEDFFDPRMKFMTPELFERKKKYMTKEEEDRERLEREKIKQFWVSLSDTERRELVRLEKEAVLKKMKEQQRHTCSCSVCGRRRTVIEEELEMLYDAYYEELENYEEGNQSKGGILSVADDLLKNEGKKFLEMMEKLVERRAQSLAKKNSETSEQSDYEEETDEEEYDPDVDGEGEEDTGEIEGEEEFEDSVEESQEVEDEDDDQELTEEQRLEEGRRMFQMFAAKMFEQRVLAAYREKVALENQRQLLLEEEAAEKERKKKEEEKLQKELQKKQKQQELREKQLQAKLDKEQEEQKKMEERRKQQEEARKKQIEIERQRREQKEREKLEKIAKEKEFRQKQEEARKKKEEDAKKKKESEKKVETPLIDPVAAEKKKKKKKNKKKDLKPEEPFEEVLRDTTVISPSKPVPVKNVFPGKTILSPVRMGSPSMKPTPFQPNSVLAPVYVPSTLIASSQPYVPKSMSKMTVPIPTPVTPVVGSPSGRSSTLIPSASSTPIKPQKKADDEDEDIENLLQNLLPVSLDESGEDISRSSSNTSATASVSTLSASNNGVSVTIDSNSSFLPSPWASVPVLNASSDSNSSSYSWQTNMNQVWNPASWPSSSTNHLWASPRSNKDLISSFNK